MTLKNSFLTVAYLNIHGQTKLPTAKQLQIQDIIKTNKIDILHMQECEINSETFSTCDLLSSSFNIISNNSQNGFGTASLVRSDLNFQNVKCDTAGRGIVFDIGKMTFGNFYAHSGTNGTSRANRETFCGEIIPNLLINRQSSGCIGGDFNMIINKQDATTHQTAKMSPTFQRVVSTFSLVDSFRMLYPTVKQFSRYYSSGQGQGATRIDRCYHYGDVKIKSAKYIPIAFSDHQAHVITIELPDPFSRLLCPESKPSFRIKAEVVLDDIFQKQLSEAMEVWQNVRSFGLNTLSWWENLVKPGIKKLAQKRSREINRTYREELDLLRLRQCYLNRKIVLGDTWRLAELKTVHTRIDNWYCRETNKIKYQSQIDEHQSEETVRVYHHELHKK